MIYSIVLFATFQVLTANLLPEQCGYSEEIRIIQGDVTRIAQYPWTARILYETENRTEVLCNGVLINKRYVITQAGCVNIIGSKRKLKGVRLGEYNIATEMDCVLDEVGSKLCSDPPIDISIEDTVAHELYNNKSTGNNDIALLRLSKDVEFTDYISPICLPISEEDKTKIYNGKRLLVTGWGSRTFKETTQPDVKLQFRLRGISKEECNQKYKKLNVVIEEGQLCASGDNRFCQKSTGNPLMVSRSGRWMLVGTESFGLICDNVIDYPNVYTNIGYYSDWILSHMKP